MKSATAAIDFEATLNQGIDSRGTSHPRAASAFSISHFSHPWAGFSPLGENTRGGFLCSSFISDASGTAIQHLQYLPFGETFVDQRNSSYNTPYKFSAKEKDEETGYSYFGARYYWPEVSVWLSVDLMSDNAPQFTPYSYCFSNPVNLQDPDGNWPWEPKNVREARKHEKETGGKFHRWKDDFGDVWASVDYSTSGDKIERPKEAEGGGYCKVYKPEGESWSKRVGNFIKKLDDGGSADGANRGTTTKQDVAVGLGMAGLVTGAGIMVEGGLAISAIIVNGLSIINSIDDIGTNKNGESISQQFVDDKAVKNGISNAKSIIGVTSFSKGLSNPKETLKTPFRIMGTLNDGASTINNTVNKSDYE